MWYIPLGYFRIVVRKSRDVDAATISGADGSATSIGGQLMSLIRSWDLEQ
jgi:hypothetical protein